MAHIVSDVWYGPHECRHKEVLFEFDDSIDRGGKMLGCVGRPR